MQIEQEKGELWRENDRSIATCPARRQIEKKGGIKGKPGRPFMGFGAVNE